MYLLNKTWKARLVTESFISLAGSADGRGGVGFEVE